MVSGSLDNFCDGIATHVAEEISSVLSQAEKKAERKIQQAKEQADVLSKKMLEAANARASKMTVKSKAENASALRKEELKMQGKIRKHIFKEIAASVQDLKVDRDKYSQLLFKLSVEAVLFFGESVVEMLINSADVDIIDENFISKVVSAAASKGQNVSITLSSDRHEHSGIILRAGNVLWENTLEKRLDVFGDEVDGIIITEILEKIRS